ncbi:MAG: ComF family protein [Legionellaceae bacterium]|nr:ComF family protein [Legionellaceae bacterium]
MERVSALSYKISSIPYLLRLKTPCALCRRLHRGPYSVCTFCEHALIPLGPACQHCATPLINIKNKTKLKICSQCIKKKPALDHVFASYRFEEPLRTLLHDFKYRESLHLAKFLVSIMGKIPPTECLIPVPSHKKRLKKRGFNHAVILAQLLAKKIQRPCLTSHIQKIVDTPSQAKLDAPERRRNLQNTFKIKALPYQHVTLVDDLITTGSTANELALQLKAQGVARVDLCCIAKTCLE